MMPQMEAHESDYEQAGASYGGYQGNQTHAHQYYDPSYEQPIRERLGAGGKVYPEPRDNKNMFRLGIFLISMGMLLVCALLFVFFLGGSGGWISFIVAAFVIFLIAVVTLDKIK
ncbi:MAG TPA: hypothetical protein VJ761_16975 [Ktedonobacteraceae bacterium]|nr:hypothetical protein [Ktedonobacteraceae bacterium]